MGENAVRAQAEATSDDQILPVAAPRHLVEKGARRTRDEAESDRIYAPDQVNRFDSTTFSRGHRNILPEKYRV